MTEQSKRQNDLKLLRLNCLKANFPLIFKMPTCDNCEKTFVQKASLLRHISHSLYCKSHYGPERLEELRIDGKLEAKRKWWKGHSNDANIENKFNDNKKAKLQKYFKKRYVPAEKRNTDEGKCFIEFYKIIFNTRKGQALEKLDKSGFAYDKVCDLVFDKAVDLVFEESDTYMNIFKELDYEPGTKDIDEMFEDSLTQSFDVHYEKLTHEAMDNWLDDVNLQIELQCYDQGKENSFIHFFSEFCVSTYPDIEKEAMDKVFETIGDPKKADLDDMDDDTCMNLIHEGILHLKFINEAKEVLKEVAETNQLAQKIADKIDIRISKQIRFMKNKEYK